MTWYDFDDFEGNAGYNGKLTISQLPACGTLTALSYPEGTDFIYSTPDDPTTDIVWDDVSVDYESTEVVMNMVVDITVQ